MQQSTQPENVRVTDDAEVEATTPDPRDTDHPTGTEQAAENAANESPS